MKNPIKQRERHGMRWTPEYEIWKAIKSRCYSESNKDYADYGGRGITVCDRWKNSFINFFSDVGPRQHKRLWFDRIDNSRGYEPENCAWRTVEEQQRNKRSNHRYFIRGENLTVREMVESYARPGISMFTVKTRLRLGWETEKALFHPIRK